MVPGGEDAKGDMETSPVVGTCRELNVLSNGVSGNCAILFDSILFSFAKEVLSKPAVPDLFSTLNNFRISLAV